VQHDEREDILARVAAELQKPVRGDDALDERIMRAVKAGSAGRWRRLARWLVRPQQLALAPAVLVVIAVAVAGITFAVEHGIRGVTSGGAASSDHAQLVQFVVVDSSASTVALVGDFNDWDPEATRLAAEGANGVWAVTVPLAPGRHQYAYLVDGEKWITDRNAPTSRVDDFGKPNSVILVAGSRP
jgi:hypothetical protein